MVVVHILINTRNMSLVIGTEGLQKSNGTRSDSFCFSVC